MHTSNIIEILIATISLWVAIVTSRQLLRIVRGVHRHRLFAKTPGLACHGFGQRGISLLCRITDNDERLHNLLAVEYPNYEVIAIIDSLRNPEALHRLISRYRMIAVDGCTSSNGCVPHIKRMYRSTNRCYRQLLLLDIATSEQRTDLDAAFDMATYDYLLPLWGDERLQRGTIERLAAEASSIPHEEWEMMVVGVGQTLQLIKRHTATKTGGVTSINSNRVRCHYVYEPLLINKQRPSLWQRVAIMAFAATILLSVATTAINAFSIGWLIITLTLMAIAVAAFAAMALTSSGRCTTVGYVDNLSLFCKKLLPRIWQIKK
jgi:hypothetical protein